MDSPFGIQIVCPYCGATLEQAGDGLERGRAWDLMRAAIERGAKARVESREVALPPLVEVFLDDTAGEAIRCLMT